MTDERARATAQLQQLGAVIKDEAQAFDSVVAPLAKIVSQLKAIEKAHNDDLDNGLKDNKDLHINRHLGEAGRAFAKEVRFVIQRFVTVPGSHCEPYTQTFRLMLSYHVVCIMSRCVGEQSVCFVVCDALLIAR